MAIVKDTTSAYDSGGSTPTVYGQVKDTTLMTTMRIWFTAHDGHVFTVNHLGNRRQLSLNHPVILTNEHGESTRVETWRDACSILGLK